MKARVAFFVGEGRDLHLQKPSRQNCILMTFAKFSKNLTFNAQIFTYLSNALNEIF